MCFDIFEMKTKMTGAARDSLNVPSRNPLAAAVISMVKAVSSLHIVHK